MKTTPEEGKTPAQLALDNALKAYVWVKNAAGDYETIAPSNQPYLRHLSALTATALQENSPLLRYESVDGSHAHRVEIRGDYVASHHHDPVLLNFDESTLLQHSRNYTDSLLFLLNGAWEKENGSRHPGEALYHVTAPVGEMARGVYAFLQQALGQKPEQLTEWNGAIICAPNTGRGEVDVHFGKELSDALLGNALEQLIAWRRSLDPILQKKKAARPDDITVTTDFSALQAQLSPDSKIAQPAPQGRTKSPSEQLNLHF